MVNKSAIIIGSLYLSLEEIASYGISMQLIGLVSGLSTIYIVTFQPKIARLRVLKNINEIKYIYINGQFAILFTFILGGIGIFFFGNWAFEFIGSQTSLIGMKLICLALIATFLETHHSTAGAILLSKNEVPFFKASLLSGAATVILLVGVFSFFDLGILTLIIVPGIVQASYQNWKWPFEVVKELSIKISDFSQVIKKSNYKI